MLSRNGAEVHRVQAGDLVYASDRRGVYRAEVCLPAGRAAGLVPWIVGNPIYVGERERRADAAPADTSGPAAGLDAADKLWGVEHDGRSHAELERSAGGVGLRFTLASAADVVPFAALDATTTIPPGSTGIAFRGRADRPMRLSVQIRVVTAGEGKRWQRSIYLDERDRDIVIPFAQMTRRRRARVRPRRRAECQDHPVGGRHREHGPGILGSVPAGPGSVLLPVHAQP